MSRRGVYCFQCLVIVVVLSAVPTFVSAQVPLWARQFGSAAGDAATGVAVHANDVYVVGSTTGELPGQVHVGHFDAYIRKYDTTGNELWTRQFGTVFLDGLSAVTVHGAYIYAGGTVGDALPGQTNAGNNDAFLRKYDQNGNEVWTRQFGSADTDFVNGIAGVGDGIYVVGGTLGTLPGQIGGGLDDAFIRKYDINGNEVWTRQFGTSAPDVAFAVAAQDTGIYVVGMTFGQLSGQVNIGSFDAFIRKYDSEGNEVWTRQFGTANEDAAYSVSAAAQRIYVAGYTFGTLPGQASAGGRDAFARSYDKDGNEIWTNQFGTVDEDYARAISALPNGIFVTGATDGTLAGQVNAGAFDAFARSYDRHGNELWTMQFGANLNDEGAAVAAAETGIYVAGTTGGAFPDAFIVKFTDKGRN